METAYVTCPLCEATCGLEVTLAGGRIQTVRGDKADPFSQGFICPKGASFQALHDDPARLRAPLVQRDGSFVEVSWDEAFAEIERRLPAIRRTHGDDSIAAYVGNPGAHNLASMLYGRVLWKALGTHNFYTAGTVDQVPKHLSCG
jgi:anaerobic selenocysteine-containing dehydrogenase